ncbi:MAG: class II aldolase/adducin family protein [Endomicrobia bacterium]|nr:class II aldolase/adducin family protein [Endomicrobiia bacterium]
MNRFILRIEKEIISVCKYLAEKEYIVGTDGNVSVRVDDTKMVITPKAKSKLNLKPDDLVVIDFEGKKIKGFNEPSGEWRVHSMIYRFRQDVNAVIHTHPTYSTVSSVAGVRFDKVVLPEIIVSVGNIAVVEYGTLYTEDLAKKVQKYVQDNNAFILKNHGLVTVGEDIKTALYRTEKVEHLSKVIIIAKLLGSIDYLTDSQVEEISKLVK